MGCRKYFFFYLISHFLGCFLYNPQIKGSFENHVDMIFWFFHQPPSSVVIFYVLNMDKYGKFLTRYPPSVVYITVGTCKRLSKKMAAKYHHIFDTFKHFWVARKPNFFDPSMTIVGAAISFFMGAYAPILESVLSSSSTSCTVVRNASQIGINHVSFFNKRSCHVVFDSIQAWQILSNFGQTCQNWFKLVKIGLKLSKLVQTCSIWIKLNKNGWNFSTLDQTSQNWFKLVKLCSIFSNLV